MTHFLHPGKLPALPNAPQARSDPAAWEADADPRLSFVAPEVLEGIGNHFSLAAGQGGYDSLPGYDYLKGAHIDLEEAALTDKQLTAVCLVFYGGVKKKRAAKAMHISAQALSDHIKAALRKIEETIR